MSSQKIPTKPSNLPSPINEILIFLATLAAGFGSCYAINVTLLSLNKYSLVYGRNSVLPGTLYAFNFLISTFAILSMLCNIYCTYACWKCQLWAKSVRLLLIVDSLARVMVSAVYLPYFCYISYWGPFFECEMKIAQTYRRYAMFYLMPGYYISLFARIVLSANRFLAISFNGRFFQATHKYAWWQAGFAVVSGTVAYFYGDLLPVDGNLLYVSLAISLDLLIYVKVRTSNSKQVTSKERILVLQMLSTNFPLFYTYWINPFIMELSVNVFHVQAIAEASYYFAQFVLFSGGAFWDGLITILLIRRCLRITRKTHLEKIANPIFTAMTE